MSGLNIQVESAALHFIKLSGANEASSVPTDKHNYCNLCFFCDLSSLGWRGRDVSLATFRRECSALECPAFRVNI